MRGVASIFLLCFLAGCATGPQTRSEFIQSVQNSDTWSLADRYVVHRSFDDVVRALGLEWKACYGATGVPGKSDAAAAPRAVTDTYRPKFVRVSDSLAQLTLQYTTSSPSFLERVPPGGYFLLAVDVRRLRGAATELAWYSNAYGWKDDWAKTKQWADGKRTSCR
ncbi:MAG TPA: hypothetical protein VKA50_12710 [Gammaproteobacteria bacterium]|nr:hypothetical protein [Gammaproteobacteria bacterium]